jgi:PAS domain S-box-containing protein
MRNIKVQLLISHLVLVALLSVLLAAAVTEFSHLGQSINRIVRDNYDSVIAAENMKETLERQDSAATFYLAGEKQTARAQYAANWPLFQHWAGVESRNITERGEQQMSDDIGRQYPEYRAHIEHLLYAKQPMPPEVARAYYFNDLEPRFLKLKQRAQDVLDLNQAAILRASNRARDEAARSALTGTVLTVLAFIVSWVLASGMVKTVLGPLRRLATRAEAIGRGDFDHRISVNRSDELGSLAEAFNYMTDRLQAARKVQAERLERAERMSDTALDSLTDPVIVADQEGRVVYMNRAAQVAYGTQVPLTPRAVRDVIPDPVVSSEVASALTRKAPTLEEDAKYVTMEVSGRSRVYRIRSAPMRDVDNMLIGAVTVLEDVTHLRELDRLKTEFIGVASHELRTPVTSLVLSVDLMAEGAAGELNPTQQRIVQAQREDLERLNRLMSDLLDMSRMQDHDAPLEMSLTDPNLVARSAIESVAPASDAKGVHVGSVMPEFARKILLDRGSMARVLTNLLDNAIRHTPTGGEVTLTVDQEADRLNYIVQDTGSGIPGDYLNRLFEPFVQVPGANRGGAGLGLSIAQKIVNAHGGDITVTSTVGQGSRFKVTLPTGSAHTLQRSSSNGTHIAY